ncbi:sodium:solute symporter family protein [Actinocorallia longicatena]|uniref:Sodium:solute symporter family protein n=1 Tax=Actinocorallia longicatena TaxID=111803 RepID=A0ABP6QBX8_9ACTN
MVLAADDLRLDVNGLDYLILAIYFATVLGIGFAARATVRSSVDFFLSGRSLPAWITGLAFLSANLGATEILGMAANGAQYGLMTTHYYWIGAVPAMVFLGIVMMPFYYRSGVHSVPDFLRRRFNPQTQLLNAISFALAQVLIAGINLYALALVMRALLGWPLPVSVVDAAIFVLVYITLGGLSSAIYNEVLQFFVIVAGLLPLVLLGLKKVGGFSGLADKIRESNLGEAGLHTWKDTGFGDSNPMDANWLGLLLGLGFVLSFGYWTTNFAEVQRGLSAKNTTAARMTPIVAAYPKIIIPFVTVVPGMIALVVFPALSEPGADYNNAIPMLMGDLLPNGVLGVALTGLVASFMAGMAANVSGFNTVFTYDIWRPYLKPGRDDAYYLKTGRVITVVGVVGGVFTAFIASQYNNIMAYMQQLFSFFNAPLFATFIVGLLWRKMTPWAGFWGLLMGTASAVTSYALYELGPLKDVYGSELNASFWNAGIAFVVDVVVSIVVSKMTRRTVKPDSELRGLVRGIPSDHPDDSHEGDDRWYRSPVKLGLGALVLSLACYIPFW